MSARPVLIPFTPGTRAAWREAFAVYPSRLDPSRPGAGRETAGVAVGVAATADGPAVSLGLDDARAFADGFEFRLLIEDHARAGHVPGSLLPEAASPQELRRAARAIPDEVLCVGVLHDNGAFAVQDAHPFVLPLFESAGGVTPVLRAGEGYGDARGGQRLFWTSPIPPTGDLSVVVRWRRFLDDDLEFRIDGDALRAAADAAT